MRERHLPHSLVGCKDFGMAGFWWAVAGAVIGLVLLLVLLWRPARTARQERQYALAQREFRRQREQLEARFLKLAGDSGKPRGLRWVDCDFQNEVTYARDRSSGELSALVGVTISFEAIEGGGMEEVEAVGNLRAATAVFQYADGRWATQGRAIFNLNPLEAIQYYQSKLERVG